MNFERPKKQDKEVVSPSKEKIPTSLAERIGFLMPTLFRIEAQGLDRLKELPPEKHIIFVVTHMSEYDVPISIAALAKEFPQLKVAEASTHEEFSKNPAGYLGRQAIGPENSFSVDYTEEKRGGAVFNPDNYEPMSEALEGGSSIVMAAYYDPAYPDKEWRLPKKGGNGGVYLAQITPDSVMVPVAVDIKSEKPFGMGEPGITQIIKELRPKVEVKIGKPIMPEQIPNIEKFAEILHKRKNKEILTNEERQEFMRIRKALRQESDRVMAGIAEMLPAEKRARE